jgi:hypothetical protein
MNIKMQIPVWFPNVVIHFNSIKLLLIYVPSQKLQGQLILLLLLLLLEIQISPVLCWSLEVGDKFCDVQE